MSLIEDTLSSYVSQEYFHRKELKKLINDHKEITEDIHFLLVQLNKSIKKSVEKDDIRQLVLGYVNTIRYIRLTYEVNAQILHNDKITDRTKRHVIFETVDGMSIHQLQKNLPYKVHDMTPVPSMSDVMKKSVKLDDDKKNDIIDEDDADVAFELSTEDIVDLNPTKVRPLSFEEEGDLITDMIGQRQQEMKNRQLEEQIIAMQSSNTMEQQLKSMIMSKDDSDESDNEAEEKE